MKCHILTLRDKGALCGENGISSSSANLGRSVEHWRRLRSGDVEPDPGSPQGQSRSGRESSSVLTPVRCRGFHKILGVLSLTNCHLVLHELLSLLLADLFCLQFFLDA